MHILDHLLEVRIIMNVFCSEGFYEESADALVLRIEIHGVCRADLLHEARYAVLGYFSQHEVEMIRHQAVGDDGDKRRTAICLQEIRVRFIAEYFAVVRFMIVAEIECLQKTLVIHSVPKRYALVYTARVAVKVFVHRKWYVSIRHIPIIRLKRNRRRLFRFGCG